MLSKTGNSLYLIRTSLFSMFSSIREFIFKKNDMPVDETRLRGEVIKILMQASIFTGLFMGVIFLLQYEVEDARPNLTMALFTFIMSFSFTILVWMFNVYIINLRILPFISQWTSPKYEFILRGCISLMASVVLMWIWAEIDRYFGMEYRDKPNIFAFMQVRGLIIVAISLTITWGIGQALAQQNALTEISKLKEENFEAKFEVLKQQIQPHFLFNSLNILKGMIRTQNENAEDYIVRLAEVYRYILQSNTHNLVPISDELMVLDAYVFMLKIRFRDAIDLKINLSDKIKRSSIPPLTLQILVENCVKHNVLSQHKPLTINIFEENNYIVIQNNLQVKNALDSSNKVGLANIAQRYNLVNGQKVIIERTPQYFTIKLPILT